jgi:acylphosphatase
MGEKIRAHILVSGRVQGVFYREGAKEKAKELGIFGWIKNLRGGMVEAVFEGEKENVEKILQWARKGTFAADVQDMKINIENYTGEFSGFEIRYDLN